jgi:hypothetical protein
MDKFLGVHRLRSWARLLKSIDDRIFVFDSSQRRHGEGAKKPKAVDDWRGT